jgi:hypothetical protein
MKTLILFFTTLFIFNSCSEEIESEHFNPNQAIKVNFETKKGYEGGKELILANNNETDICTKIIRGQELPITTKFESICSGSNDKGLHFSYLHITGEINGLFLVIHDENRILSYRLNSFSGNCLLKWVMEI